MRRVFWIALFSSQLILSIGLLGQFQQTSNIVGRLRIVRGDFPSHRVMIELQFRGSAIGTTYADEAGNFGFANLIAGEYHVVITDGDYSPVDERVIIRPEVTSTAMVSISLEPREQPRSSTLTRATGTNPHMVDLAEYRSHFSKSVLKEFDKGVQSDKEGDSAGAISHYEKAVKIAPDFYPAHNNLGSAYLNKSDFEGARTEFEEVVRLNQSDAAGYFNLSNVCLLTGKLDEAQQFLNEGMRREPDSALGYFLRGSLDMRTTKYQEAESELRQAIQASPVMTQARLQLINLLLKEGKNSEAKSELHDFIHAFPDNNFTPKAKQLLQRLEDSSNAAVPH
jgi:tetratricopeptide (TPR) repeat protein